jgi:hypothetical protein
MVGLTFIIFVGVGAYSILSSCRTNILNTYKKITNKSNLHDFVVNEGYRSSNPTFKLCDQNNGSN